MREFIRGCYQVISGNNSDVNCPLFLLKSLYYSRLSKHIFAHHNTTISGLRNIQVQGHLFVGTAYVGFLNKYDRTFLNIGGKLVIQDHVNIGKGCRFDICKGAICTLRRCSITGQSNFIIAHSLDIGEGSVISWGCEFLDDDWHELTYEGRVQKVEDHGIVIGNHVWVGSHVKLLKGVHIGSNSVIGANAVVTRSFPEEHVLIAGNPATIVKRGVEWQ